MDRTSRVILRLAPIAALALLMSCNSGGESGNGNATPNAGSGTVSSGGGDSSAAMDPNAVVATAKGIKVTAGELETAIAGERYRMAQRLYQTQQQSAQQLVVEKLLQKEAGDQKLEEYLEAKASEDPITDEDIEKIYDQYRRQLGPVLTDEVRERIKGHVKQQRIASYVKDLLDKSDFQFALEPPEPPLVDVSVDDDPYKGEKDAPVTIIMFSDFQCPACRQAAQMLPTILGEFPGKVKLVYRDFPLDIHPNAMPAAIAAGCANEQGKFWEMHDALFANQRKLSQDDLKGYAADLKLDSAKFAKCLDDPARVKEIYNDMEDGRKIGISATPTFVVNGRMMSGLNADTLRRQIKKELGMEVDKT